MMLYGRLLAATFFAVPSAAFAWGPEGHQVVALIAYAHLTPEAKAGTKALLGDGRDIYDAEVADWADVIRQAHKELGPYHYVDADVSLRSIDLERDGADGKNVVDGIVDQLAVLRGEANTRQIVLLNPDEKPGEKTESHEQALRFIVHLVGDVEQPLHCCDRNQDQGGNKVRVHFLNVDKDTNLHSVWDGAMLRIYVGDYFNARNLPRGNAGGNANGPAHQIDNGKEVPDITDYAMSLDAKITPQQRKMWAAGTPLDWANESHELAAKSIYADLPLGDPVPLDARYVAAKKAIVETQLERGGVRLAAVLNKSFATGRSSPATRPVR